MDAHDPLSAFLNPVRKIRQKIRVRGHTGFRTIKEVDEETVTGKSGSLDTYVTETDMKLDCGCYGREGGVCDICHSLICEKCFKHCASCGKAICNRCTKWREERALCEECHWNEKLIAVPKFFFGKLFGRRKKNK